MGSQKKTNGREGQNSRNETNVSIGHSIASFGYDYHCPGHDGNVVRQEVEA